MYQQVSQYGVHHVLFLFSVLLSGGPAKDQPLAPTTAASPPNRAIVIRLSESIFQPGDGGKVDHASRVDRTVLGTRVTGESRTVGQTRVDLVSDQDDGSFRFIFTGASYSKTSGNNGPAIIHNSATTQFQCSKRITFDLENGFHSAPSEVKASTQLKNDGITTRRRGLLGRVVRNVAARRVRDTQPEAEAITNRDTERDVARGFDEAIDKQIAQLNKQLDLPRLLAAIFGTATRNNYCVRSNSRYLEICFHDADKGSPKDLKLPEEQVADAPVQVWARNTLFDGKVRTAIRAYEVAENVIEKIAPNTDLAKELGLGGTSMESSNVDFVDGWIIFAWKPENSLGSLAAAEGEVITR
jgi:hypothetical protein